MGIYSCGGRAWTRSFRGFRVGSTRLPGEACGHVSENVRFDQEFSNLGGTVDRIDQETISIFFS